MSYIYLGDLRNTHLGQASGSPEQLEKAAAGLEATAKGLRAGAVGPAAAGLTAQAQALESQAAALRRSAAQKRGESTPSTAVALPTSDAPTKTNWLMIVGAGAGLLALGGGIAWAFANRKSAPSKSTAVMAMNKGGKSKRAKKRSKR